MKATYTHREELGNFALEISTPSFLGCAYDVILYRLHEPDENVQEWQWLEIHGSRVSGDDFSDLLIDARYRMLQYFKGDCFNTRHIEQEWFQDF